MFRETSNQASFFNIEILVPGALPNDDWSYRYREYVLPLIAEEKFRHLYAEEGGAPNKSIRTKISLLIFMGMEKHTWRGTAFQFPRRLDWLNATWTPIGEAKIDHTTLFDFYRRLEKDDTARDLFNKLTSKFVKLCGTSLKKQRTDSFFIHGWLQILSRYGLLKETIQKFLFELQKKSITDFTKVEGKLSKKYLNKKFDLTEKDQDKAKLRVKEMAHDMYLLIQEFDSNEKVSELESFKIFKIVFNQQCKVVEENEYLVEIEIREKPEGKKIINTPHNTDAEFTRKNKQKVTGHKGFVSETCAESNETQFITDVNVTGSTTADSKELSEIHDRTEKADLKPEKQYVDAGFVNGGTIISSAENDIKIEGPSSGRSQSIEGFQEENRPLDVADFKVTINDSLDSPQDKIEKLVVDECPQGQTPIDQDISVKTGKVNVHFNVEQCMACPLKERCPVKIGKTVSTFTLDEAAYIGALRHHQYMEDTDYRKQCSVRAGVEGTVNEIANTHGMRKAKHRKESRVKLQMLFAALSCNVKRFIRHGDNYAYSMT